MKSCRLIMQKFDTWCMCCQTLIIQLLHLVRISGICFTKIKSQSAGIHSWQVPEQLVGSNAHALPCIYFIWCWESTEIEADRRMLEAVAQTSGGASQSANRHLYLRHWCLLYNIYAPNLCFISMYLYFSSCVRHMLFNSSLRIRCHVLALTVQATSPCPQLPLGSPPTNGLQSLRVGQCPSRFGSTVRFTAAAGRNGPAARLALLASLF